MSRSVLYRMYWMATLKDRHKCCVCGNLATSALEFQDENGISNS
jgi:hypothetical protein